MWIIACDFDSWRKSRKSNRTAKKDQANLKDLPNAWKIVVTRGGPPKRLKCRLLQKWPGRHGGGGGASNSLQCWDGRLRQRTVAFSSWERAGGRDCGGEWAGLRQEDLGGGGGGEEGGGGRCQAVRSVKHCCSSLVSTCQLFSTTNTSSTPLHPPSRQEYINSDHNLPHPAQVWKFSRIANLFLRRGSLCGSLWASGRGLQVIFVLTTFLGIEST